MDNTDRIQIAAALNKVANFLAKRDIEELSSKELIDKYGISAADLIIILGSSIPYIAKLGARAFNCGLAKEIMIVGGIGHSTKYLVDNVLKDSKYENVDVREKSEAEILRDIIVSEENINKETIIIENKSTNCGSNANEALKILKEKGKVPKSVILLQDPTMQLRSHASFAKEWEEENPLLISYAPFIPEIIPAEDNYSFTNDEVDTLWSIDRFIDLIMGEIPRLRDDVDGYGPMGKGYISHVNVPEDIIYSYEKLLSYYNEYNEIKMRK